MWRLICNRLEYLKMSIKYRTYKYIINNLYVKMLHICLNSISVISVFLLDLFSDVQMAQHLTLL